MAIRRWGDPFRELISLQEMMNRLFEESMLRSSGKEEEMLPSTWSPVVDIYETSEELVVTAELPGIDLKDISIEIKDNTLFLRGERKFEKDVAKENYHRMERSYGHFQRSFALPSSVHQEKTKAKIKEGVLEITLPKTEKTKVKKIDIEVK